MLDDVCKMTSDELSALKVSYGVLKKEQSELQTKLNTQTKDSEQKLSLFSELEDNIVALKQEITSLQTTNSRLESKVEKANSQLHRCSEELSENEVVLRTCQDKRYASRARNVRLVYEQNTLQQEVEALRRRGQATEAAVDAREKSQADRQELLLQQIEVCF